MGDLAVKGSKGQEDTLGQCFIEDFLLMPLLESFRVSHLGRAAVGAYTYFILH